MNAEPIVDRKRLLIFVVAYNAERTIEDVLRRVPHGLGDDYDVEILIIDDSSSDDTFRKSELLKRAGLIPFPITVLFNPVNQGYGGNQKIGFHYAIKNGFDFVALLHGDGQYAPECLPGLVDVLSSGQADAVFGSRMMDGASALKGGMPLYKFVGNRILTTIQNFVLGSNLSEFHSGYRLYSTRALASIPFDLNSNDFHFDTEIIIQLLTAKLSIREIPIPTFYGDEICYVNGLKYAANVLIATLQASMQKYHVFYDRRFDCMPEEDAPPPRDATRPVERAFLGLADPGSTVLVAGPLSRACRSEMDRRGDRVVSLEAGLMQYLADNGRRDPGQRPFDWLFLLDDGDLSRQPDRLVDTLKAFCDANIGSRVVLVTGNIGFFVTRLTHLFGRFSYARKGILSFGQFRFFTRRSLKRLFAQNGFEIESSLGVHPDYRGSALSPRVAAVLGSIHSALVPIRPSLFAYQLLVVLKLRPTLERLLQNAMTTSAAKAADVDTYVGVEQGDVRIGAG